MICLKTDNYGPIDYNSYEMDSKEKLLNFIAAGLFIAIVSYIFYRNILISLFLVSLAIFYFPIKKKQIIRTRKEDLNLQFKDALYSVSSSLSAGKSIESAFKEALKDIKILYQNDNTFIIKELECISRKIDMNETIESALEDFAARSHLDDVKSFVDVFRICKRTGGNLVQVIRNTSDIINDKIATKQEISIILAQRKFEQKLLSIIPVGMIYLIYSTSPEFMEPMYTQISGRIVMTIALVLIAAAWFISGKVMNIEV
ncbi:MAG: type II secretion system F family protein [Deltaproteobacteria bacterium]